MTRIFSIGVLVLWAQSAVAQSAPVPEQVDALLDAIRLRDTVEVMTEESLSYGQEIGDDIMAGGGQSPVWVAQLQDIYDVDRQYAVMRRVMARELGDRDLTPILEFYGDGVGAEAIALEIEARRALLDQAAEDAAIARLEELRDDNDPRLDLVEQFVEANDLVELNVSGGLNAEFAFLSGFYTGSGAVAVIPESDILSEVWGREQEVRDSTSEWLAYYLLMAYHPLSDAELQAYIDYSETEAGRALNLALFAAFDVLFTQTSRELGFATGQMVVGEDI